MTRTVAVTGASGFVGRELVKVLRSRGVRVIALGRREGAGTSQEIERRHFDPNQGPNPAAFEGADAVIHLAGESVAGRWTLEKKRRIAESRVAGTRTLVESLSKAARRPDVVVSASAIGYYGDRGDEILTEESSPGSDFLARVCIDWEAAARECEALGIRCVRMRTGVVMGKGGALAQMTLPFKFFAGGPLGSGRQYVPWITVEDLAALYCLAVEDSALAGAVNAVTPDYATNARLSQAIGAALARPSLLPAPPFALRLALGEFARTLLAGQLIVPTVALDAGFRWRHRDLESALGAILGGSRARRYVHTFRASQFVARPLDEVFEFFSSARNLEAIIPPALSFALRSAPDRLRRGAVIAYDLRLHGFPIRWKTLITEFEPMRRFVDVQLRGPYLLWRHLHEFKPVDGGVEVSDRVDYALPFAPFGEFVRPLVTRDIADVFRFRRERIERQFATRKPDRCSAPSLE
jgi:uncharacterized protein